MKKEFIEEYNQLKPILEEVYQEQRRFRPMGIARFLTPEKEVDIMDMIFKMRSLNGRNDDTYQNAVSTFIALVDKKLDSIGEPDHEFNFKRTNFIMYFLDKKFGSWMKARADYDFDRLIEKESDFNKFKEKLHNGRTVRGGVLIPKRNSHPYSILSTPSLSNLNKRMGRVFIPAHIFKQKYFFFILLNHQKEFLPEFYNICQAQSSTSVKPHK